MARVKDNWGLRYPGAKKAEHAYFYGADVSDAETRGAWLDQASRLGKDPDS